MQNFSKICDLTRKLGSLASLALLLAACGSGPGTLPGLVTSVATDAGRLKGTPSTAGGPSASGKGAGAGRASTGPAGAGSSPDAPGQTQVVTFLAPGTVVPSTLKASALRLYLRSNVAGASFECAALTQPNFAPCSGLGEGRTDSYDFGALVHSMSYTLKARAVAPDGRRDAHPLTVSFVVDMTGGTAPSLPDPSDTAIQADSRAGAAAKVAAAPRDLVATKAAPERLLQVGAYYGVAVPAAANITSYSTNMTIGNQLHLMAALGSVGTIVGAAPAACTATYQRIVKLDNGQSYCDGTPALGEWPVAARAGAGLAPVPMNHLEMDMVLAGGLAPLPTPTPSGGVGSMPAPQNGAGSPSHAGERLVVAAYTGSVTDSAAAAAEAASEAALSLDATCQGAVAAGQIMVPALNDFYHNPLKVNMRWCETYDSAAGYVWIGSFTLPTSVVGALPSHLRVTYSVGASYGIFSGNQFAERLQARLPSLLVPLAPLP